LLLSEEPPKIHRLFLHVMDFEQFKGLAESKVFDLWVKDLLAVCQRIL